MNIRVDLFWITTILTISMIFSKLTHWALLSIDTLWFFLQSPGGLNSFGPIFTYWEQIFESILPLFFSSLNNFVSLFWKSRQGSQMIQEQKHFFVFKNANNLFSKFHKSMSGIGCLHMAMKNNQISKFNRFRKSCLNKWI